MTQRLPTHVARRSRGQFFVSGRAEVVQASLALLSELETSLEVLQRALLSRDLAGIERATQAQIRCQRALAVLWAAGNDPSADDRATEFRDAKRPLSLPAELQAALVRVLHLGRVQSALLVRARRSLVMTANLLSSPQTSYDLSHGFSCGRSPAACEPDRSAPCRA
jgi:hypothetical protein